MAIQLAGGQILLKGGIIAAASNCCCGDPCICSDHTPSPHHCICLTEDYGDIKAMGPAIVTITGTSIAHPWHDPLVYGDVPTCPGGECASIAGTYVVECATSKIFCVNAFVCTSYGVDIYYVTVLTVYNLATVQIGLESYWTDNISYSTGCGDRPPNDPLNRENIARASWSWTPAFQTHDALAYVASAQCRPECNAIIQYNKCISGEQPLTYHGAYESGRNHCKLTDYAVSLSIGAPT